MKILMMFAGTDVTYTLHCIMNITLQLPNRIEPKPAAICQLQTLHM